jgi:CPA2 family monovalent cation:H+ antiporter-2
MMLDLPFLIHNFHKIFFLGTFIVGIKMALLFALVWFTGSPGSVSRAVAALLFQFGEFSFILSELGVQNNLISEKDRQFFVAIAIFSLAVTPLIYKLVPSLMHSEKLQNILPIHIQNYFRNARKKLLEKMTSPLDLDAIRHNQELMTDHVIVIGYGVAGQSLCRVLQHLKIPFQVIELNAETVRVNTQHIPIIYGDATNPELLRKAGIKTARMAVVVTTGVNMLQPIMHAIERENPSLRVIARTNYLLDLKRLPANERIQFVVSELETTLNIIDRTLRDFSVDLVVVDELVSELRKEFDLTSTLRAT